MQLSVNVKLVLLLASLAATGSASADTVYSPSTEYRDRIKVAQTIQPSGDTPFGESVNLYKGGLSFRQTDISFPGIGPTITLARSYSIGGATAHGYGFDDFGDWSLSIPRIETIIPGDRYSAHGEWKVGDGTSGYARCSNFRKVSVSPFLAFGMSWWNGYQLVTPDGNSQPMLKRTSENTIAPSAGTYNIVTSSNWMISCLPSTDNVEPGMQGEAFFAIAPDGTKYWFNHLVYGPPLQTLVYETEGAQNQYLARKMGYMYATRIEDRFGNYITYAYNSSGKPTGITGSDGRRVSISWRSDGKVISGITMQPGTPEARTWTYSYGSAKSVTLVRAIQPDLSAWTFAMNDADRVQAIPDNQGCGSTDMPGSTPAPITITHPSGLVGVFNVDFVYFARTMVPTTCGGNPPQDLIPVSYLAISLLSKTISGPGLTSQAWTYSYSVPFGSSLAECPLPSSCPTSSWVEVTAPDGSASRYTHLTRWGAQEGKLLSVVAGKTASNPAGLRSETHEYASEAQGPYPSRFGENLDGGAGIVNNGPIESISPEWRTVVYQQDVAFTNKVNAFDVYGSALSTTESSVGNAGGDTSRTQVTSYRNDIASWVLGLPQSVSQAGVVTSKTDYDPTSNLPITRYGFGGLPQQKLTYNGNGTIATVKDGNNNVVSLSDWYRGVPRLVRLPQSTLSATVDATGKLLTTTDELANTTGYGYDAMARLAAINYPGQWNPLARSFMPVPSLEYGLPAGHWRETVQTGNGKTTTLYDARWQSVLTLTEDVSLAGSKSFVVRRFDGLGRPVFTSYPVGSASVNDTLPGIVTDYDALGRVVRVKQDSELGVLTTTTEYLPGFKTRVTNPRGNATSTSYQVFGSPSTGAPVRIDAPLGTVTQIQRSEFGVPVTVTRSGPGG